MINILASIEHKIGENAYKFMCPANLNLDEAKQAIFFFMKAIAQLEDQAKAQQEQQQATPVSEVAEEQPEQPVEGA